MTLRNKGGLCILGLIVRLHLKSPPHVMSLPSLHLLSNNAHARQAGEFYVNPSSTPSDIAAIALHKQLVSYTQFGLTDVLSMRNACAVDRESAYGPACKDYALWRKIFISFSNDDYGDSEDGDRHPDQWGIESIATVDAKANNLSDPIALRNLYKDHVMNYIFWQVYTGNAYIYSGRDDDPHFTENANRRMRWVEAGAFMTSLQSLLRGLRNVTDKSSFKGINEWFDFISKKSKRMNVVHPPLYSNFFEEFLRRLAMCFKKLAIEKGKSLDNSQQVSDVIVLVRSRDWTKRASDTGAVRGRKVTM